MAGQTLPRVEPLRPTGAPAPEAEAVYRPPFWQHVALNLALAAAPTLVKSAALRRPLVRRLERALTAVQTGDATRSAGVTRDRVDFALAVLHTAERLLAEGRLGRVAVDRLLNLLLRDSMILKGDAAIKERFVAEHGVVPPSFLVISPGQGCNLKCAGCYASSNAASRSRLSWDVFDRLVTEERELWGGRFVVVSGGEPLVYRDQGRTLLDMAAQHPDMFFMFYTNGTLIDRDCARRLAELGNVAPAISIEGLRASTDARRGGGVFDKIIEAADNLRAARVLFGLSMTATRDNYRELLSDELIDLFFGAKGAAFAWLFHYMPIGRSYTLDLMPTPEQRQWLWERGWQLIRERQVFIADFWNAGTIVDGCLSAGRSGGYLYVDWNGAVSPCVFVPYAPVNINALYAGGQTLNDAWAAPYFEAIRQWQRQECGFCVQGSKSCANLLTPCLIRDHHDVFMRLATQHEPDPIDEAAAEALADAGYHQGLLEFGQALHANMEPVWRARYVDDDGMVRHREAA